MFLLQAAVMKPTQKDRENAAVASRASSEAAKDTTLKSAPTSNTSQQQQPTVVYVTPPPTTNTANSGAHQTGAVSASHSWHKFLYSGMMSAMFTVGLTSVAKRMDWIRNFLDPGATKREAEILKQAEEATAKADKAITAQAEAATKIQTLVLKQQQQQQQNSTGQRYGMSGWICALYRCNTSNHYVWCLVLIY